MALLGCIADDFTGATDLASTLVATGMRTVQVIGVPGTLDGMDGPDAPDAIVVALKSRTAPARDAVADSLAALDWLRRTGCTQFVFKYCSTFDSTEHGNIGPVAEALIAALGCGFALACPAFPTNGRTVFQGHLFVGHALLNESGMEHHPLTPMTDANLVRVLGRQTEGAVGLVDHATVARGADAIRRAMTACKEQGRRLAIVDAIDDSDLRAIGRAAAGHALITGGSGIALGLADNFRAAGTLPERSDPGALPELSGAAAVIAGSCSRATLFQIGTARDRFATLELDPLAMPDARAMIDHALTWADGRLGAPIVIAASAPPERVAAIQQRLGREQAGDLIEHVLAEIAAGLVARGVVRLVVAGGETSGAVVSRLGVTRLRIGDQIDPGVPWTYAEGPTPMKLALKSGNFGGRDFFLRALG